MDYYQVVFTIPDRLSSLALGNRREMFELLFRTAWWSLKTVIEDEQQFEAAAAMMLHTWNQKLDAHVHVHAVVPGGGPSLSQPGTWTTAARPPDRMHHDFWLVDANVLRTEFRRRFLSGLKRLHRTGNLKLSGEWSVLREAATFDDWLQPLQSLDWVTYIQPPPMASSRPDEIVKYLARYVTGGPISDFRITHYDGQRVTFTARTGTTTGGSDDTEEIELPAVEFVRRWCLHILPKGYTTSRRFGGLSNHHSERYLAECHRLLGTNATVSVRDDSGGPDSNPDGAVHGFTDPCPHCGGGLELRADSMRTAWSDVFTSGHCPWWYRPLIRGPG